MKHSCLFSLVVLFISSSLYSQPANKKSDNIHKASPSTLEIVFMEGSWDSVMKKALAMNKYIFVDANASWCAPCRKLKVTTFRDKEAAVFFNQNFINYSIDMEKGEGPALAAQWQVDSYPTLLIFNAAGKTMLGNVGFLRPDELIKFGKQALEKRTD